MPTRDGRSLKIILVQGSSAFLKKLFRILPDYYCAPVRIEGVSGAVGRESAALGFLFLF